MPTRDTVAPGIHHVTAIAGDPQRNVDFYAGVLGLRLVKRTVNFDDPGTYHLYYGDETGTPGTIMTFFPWPSAPRGRDGAGQTTATAFTIPARAVGWWIERLSRAGLADVQTVERFGSPTLCFVDPDGLALELVESEEVPAEAAWGGADIPASAAILGFHGVTLTERRLEATAAVIERQLGWLQTAEEDDRFRFSAPGTAPGRHIDVVVRPGAERGMVAVGTVHHVAFRVADDAAQAASRASAARAGLHVTPVMDRQYFRSIYYREPGGVLFEMATDPPGFTRDETVHDLGRDLKLPPWLEAARHTIERTLPELRLPAAHPLKAEP